MRDYVFFNRKSGYVGVTAYRYEPYWEYIEDYLKLQESFDDMYGYMGLVDLVEPNMAKRFKSALYKFRVTITRAGVKFNTRKDVQQRAEICKRGLLAMKKHVDDNNLAPIPPVLIYENLGKKHFGVVKDATRLKIVMEENTDVECFYTLKELHMILENYKTIKDAKEALYRKEIPAEVTEIEKPKYKEEDFDEEVPF